MPSLRRPPRPLLLLLLALVGTEGCIVVDVPLLGLRTVAGGIHNRRRGVGIVPFFLPDGRMGCAANGGLLLEEHPGSPLREILPPHFEVDDPTASPDGRHLLFVAGREQITAGGAHKDHVFQIYSCDLEGGAFTRLTHSRRAEVLPRYLPGGERIVFVRRPDYDGWALRHSPWGDGAVFTAAADGTDEHRLTAPLFHPFRGLVVTEGGGAIVFGAASGDGTFALHRLPLTADARPVLLVTDAFLPTLVPGHGDEDRDEDEERLVYVRGRRGETTLGTTAYAAFDLCVGSGTPGDERVLLPGRGEILSLAVSPDGARVLFTEFAPGEGMFGTYVLFELPLAGGEPRPLHQAPYRWERRFKPGDLVQPLSWWGRTSRFSPGSR